MSPIMYRDCNKISQFYFILYGGIIEYSIEVEFSMEFIVKRLGKIIHVKVTYCVCTHAHVHMHTTSSGEIDYVGTKIGISFID